MSKVPRLSNKASGGGTSVYEWGAIGDGTFSETLKIQSALDNLQHVYFPPGTYLVDGTLTASLDKQVIEGAGKGSVIKMMASKTYDLTQPHAALTLDGGEQIVEDLQLVGPDTGDDSTFSGSGNDWYNLAALRVNVGYASISGVKIDRCEGLGIDIRSEQCKVSLCHIERAGLKGIDASTKEQFVVESQIRNCKQASYSNITTYPSDASAAVHLSQNHGIISDCFFDKNALDIIIKDSTHVISNNICFSGVHVEAKLTIVSNNFIRDNGGNALTVADDGNAFISSLTGNDMDRMDQGGADDITTPSSYSGIPVQKATGNYNVEIDRIYQQRAYAQIRPDNQQNPNDGSVPFQIAENAQLITVDSTNNSFAVDRNMFVQINMPTIIVNTSFQDGVFGVNNEDTNTRIAYTSYYVSYNSTSGTYFTTPCAVQTSLQPNTIYKLYMYTDFAENVADLTHDNDFKIAIADLE